MSFGAWSSILRRLVIPQDASESDPRIVLDTNDPILQALSIDAGMLLYWAEDRAYIVSVEDSGGTVGQLRISAVSERAGETSFLQCVQIDHEPVGGSYEMRLGVGAVLLSLEATETVVDGTISLGAAAPFNAATGYNRDSNTISLNGASFTSFTTAGSPTFCGFSFRAPPGGSGTLWFHARGRINTSGVNELLISPTVLTGGTVGSGSTFLIPDAGEAIAISGNVNANGDIHGLGTFRHVSGLTPGSVYNAVLMHRIDNSGDTASIFTRHMKWIPDIA